ncbi:olfactory receptor 1C1-like [Pelodytes ibericus]
MENRTSYQYFYIMQFSRKSSDQPIILFFFSTIYLLGVTLNTVIITVVCADSQLHQPLYLLLCNLSFVDICFTTVTVPKLMHILLSGNNIISFIDCFTQVFSFVFLAGIEDILLFFMAFDRYLAICKPFHYQRILNKNCCVRVVLSMWVTGCLNSVWITYVTSNISFCYPNVIYQFYCDLKDLSKIFCSNVRFQIVIYIEALTFGCCPFICTLISYSKIIRIVLSIKSADGRRKAFSTCSSHLMVLLLFYGTVVSVYMRNSSNQTDILDQVFTVLYATVTPMLNPLIYSLRNKEIRSGLRRLVGKKSR